MVSPVSPTSNPSFPRLHFVIPAKAGIQLSGVVEPSALKYSLKMLATEHIETARQFLVDADREYEAGDMLQASEKLWGAASHVVIAEMHRRGTKSSGHRAMILAVRQIAEDLNDTELRPEFAAARALHANFYHGFMEDYEYAENRELVRRFVERMIALSG